MKISKTLPSLYVLIAAALWGLTGIFVRTLNAAGLDNMQLLFFRSFITAASLIAYIFFTDRSKLKIKLRDWWCFFGTGILSFLLSASSISIQSSMHPCRLRLYFFIPRHSSLCLWRQYFSVKK